ncbi:MmgE/PrpD [Penicillium cf. griseofulvum]|uniref:MmgE/PrpD n=1 Tax=Penicillium cf. griseofulvum TaxID=2972120 RepID=A0A9W9M4R0_9EURO|nr:MmgE/PrpD [Penicillium cf. griseofulvum]
MKVIYDRGDPRQAWENRLSVREEQYVGGKVKLPPASEIPNVDLQVINFHRPVFGTFHAKFTIIDRRMAIIQSSNIQDNDNLEMLAHIEGPIVDSFYDTALLSWGKLLDPPFPLLNSPARDAPIPCHEEKNNVISTEHGDIALPEHTTESPHYDQDFEQEARRVNGCIHPQGDETRTEAVSRHLNTTIQFDTTGDAPEIDQDNMFNPYMILPHHEPFAMAVVNREPYGSPNHSNVYTPQNSAWLSAINNAQHSILIQTPNMNAEPLIEPLIDAVCRGIVVSCYLCLGYNDAGELLPFQNGTNEMTANRMYNSLQTDEEKSRLRVCYYVGKDQTRPIHNSFKKRSCHIKLMIVDEQIAIQGNGNLDTQSFFHSQEVNILIDSKLVCRAWTELINRNQNTAKYGAANTKDGCWHDPETGKISAGSIGPVPGRFSWAKGVVGAVQRMSRPYDQPIVDIVNYVYHYSLNQDDEAIWKCARTALLDAMGCAIETAATSTECRKLLGPVIEGTVVPDGFRVPGTELQVDPVKGAFDLGVLIRYLDHNDALSGTEWGHPSDNLGAILPVMDWLSRASLSGRRVHDGPPLTIQTLLIALVKAYEIQGCYQMRNAFNAYGIDHVVLVKLASAVVVCWLLGMTDEQAMATISHVWMDGHPNRVYRSGANTIPRKGWAAGDAARRAVQLALLVQDGQSGSAGALSAKPWGFWERTFGEGGFVLPRPFGSWTVQNVLFKSMPVEGHAISAVEAAVLQARRFRQRGLSDPIKRIQRIDLRTTAAAFLIVNKHGPLHNAADRDHCIQYVVALAFLKGSLPETTDYLDESPWANSEELEVLRERIVVQSDPKLTEDYLDLDKKSIGAGMTVHLADGSSLPQIQIEYPVGHARNPQTPAAIQEKFFQNMGLMFSATEIGRILGAVQNPDTLISDFIDLFIQPLAKARW